MEDELEVVTVKDLTYEQLTDFITELKDCSEYIKKEFDYYDHVDELINRTNSGKMLTRLELIRAFNELDKSFDTTSEELYVIDLEELLLKLGL